jgi:DNA repair protein RadC
MPELSIIELSDDELISHAAGILESRLRYRVSGETPEPLTTPQVVKDFLKLKLAELEHEVFAVLFLDNRHRLLHYDVSRNHRWGFGAPQGSRQGHTPA